MGKSFKIFTITLISWIVGSPRNVLESRDIFSNCNVDLLRFFLMRNLHRNCIESVINHLSFYFRKAIVKNVKMNVKEKLRIVVCNLFPYLVAIISNIHMRITLRSCIKSEEKKMF